MFRNISKGLSVSILAYFQEEEEEEKKKKFEELFV